MKTRSPLRPAFSNPRLLLSVAFCSIGLVLALLASGLFAASAAPQTPQENSGVQFGQSYHNDVSPVLRDLPAIWPPKPPKDEEAREANLNPKLPLPLHIYVPDPVIDHG